MRKIISLLFLLLSINVCLSRQTNKVRLLFAGDAMQHKSQLEAAKIKDGYDYSSYFKHIKSEFDSVDIAVVNFETTLPGKGYTGYPCFGSPDAFAYALKDAGFNVFLTANNHSLDKGKKGVEGTIVMLDSIQVKHLGTYINKEKRDLLYPMMIIKNGIRIAMLNYTYGTNGIRIQEPNVINLIDKKQILEDIELAKYMNPDIIIANLHWGDEYKLKPNKEQKYWADLFVKNGINLVIGSHPHVVEPLDIRTSGDTIQNVIVYSLGNLVSGMKAPNTDGGMMVRIDISKDESGRIRIDTCNYSLVWVHKPIENGKKSFQLIPVQKYRNEDGRQFLGDEAYRKMTIFADTAKNVIESMMTKSE